MEIEYFVKPARRGRPPGLDRHTHSWYLGLGLRKENLRQREQEKHELRTTPSAASTWSTSSHGMSGWSDRERTDFDLLRNSRGPSNPTPSPSCAISISQNKHIVPYVIEPSPRRTAPRWRSVDAYDDALVTEPPARRSQLRDLVQASRSRSKARHLTRRPRRGWASWPPRSRRVAGDPAAADGAVRTRTPTASSVSRRCAGRRQAGREYTRTVLRLHPRLAPSPGGVSVEEDEPRLGRWPAASNASSGEGLRTVYDDTGADRELYRARTKIGTPFCLTVDFKA